MFSAALLMLAGSAFAEPRNFTTIQPTGTFNPLAATAVQTTYPKDHHIVKGRLVDHMWFITLDHATYAEAEQNTDLQYLASKGILLDNYYAVEGNAQANYLAMIGGDTFGLDKERFVALPSNISTLVESMESARVLWAQYTEDQPFTAYAGWEYPSTNPTYSRAKNPFVAYDSVLENNRRYQNLRSLASLQNDIDIKRPPQWLFIRPNLDHDGSKGDLASAAKWARDFLEPHIATKKNYHRKLFILTFAYSGATGNSNNQVWTVILGDMHSNQRGTKDSSYYDHYSILSSTQANYDLPALGRYDCNANVFNIINEKAHIKHSNFPDVKADSKYNQGPFTGYLSDNTVELPYPNLNCKGAGRKGLLRRVDKIWKKASYTYEDWAHDY